MGWLMGLIRLKMKLLTKWNDVVGSDAAPHDIGIGGNEMKKQTNNEKAFLENANEAATKIREIYHIFGGYGKTSSPEEGTLLGDVYARIWDMVSLYLVSITGKDLYSDEINDMTRDILSAGKNEIENIIKEYCKISA